MDPDMSFFHAINGGTAVVSSTAGFLWRFCTGSRQLAANGKRADDAGVTGNLTGEGLTHGGLLVVARGGEVKYLFLEAEIGDHAPMEEVMAACQGL